MKVVCIATELPYPPNHGARVDILNRYMLLRQAGCEIMLITWSSQALSDADRRSLEGTFSVIEVRPIGRRLRDIIKRVWHLPRYSPHVSSRFSSPKANRDLLAKVSAFGADLVFAEEIYGSLLAVFISERLRLPLFYRSHNVEFRYMRSQARAAKTAGRKISLFLASLHLEALELKTQAAAKAVFDCSEEDAAYWRTRGLTNNNWLPNLFSKAPEDHVPWSERRFDVVFLGNLNTPNNVAGITWFVEEVMPILRSRAAFRVCVAGSNPLASVREVLRTQDEITLLPNPAEADKIWKDGRVLVNPVQTGSGSNVKSAEMLFYDSPLVCTSVGIRGLPEWIRAEFRIADRADAFAACIIDALAQGEFTTSDTRRRARSSLGPDGISFLLDLMHKAVEENQSGR